MSQNKIKYTFQNIKNIVDSGNEELVQFERKQYLIKQSKNSNEYKNRLELDENGQIYLKNKNGNLHRFKRQQYGLMPNWCPKCKRIMGKKQLDQKYWNIHKMCMDCSIKYQGELKITGHWPQYVFGFMKDKLISYCDQALEFYEQIKNQTKREVVINEQGDTQEWALDNYEQFESIANKLIQEIKLFKEQALLYFQEQISNAKNQRQETQHIEKSN